MSGKAEHSARLEVELAQYERKRLGLPASHIYWMQRFIAPRLREVFQVRNNLEIFVDAFTRSLRAQADTRRILSIGAGDCALELRVAQRLMEEVGDRFEICCLDISKARLERGRDKAEARRRSRSRARRCGGSA